MKVSDRLIKHKEEYAGFDSLLMYCGKAWHTVNAGTADSCCPCDQHLIQGESLRDCHLRSVVCVCVPAPPQGVCVCVCLWDSNLNTPRMTLTTQSLASKVLELYLYSMRVCMCAGNSGIRAHSTVV